VVQGRKEKISWADRVTNEEYYIESRRERTSYKQEEGRKANWIGLPHIVNASRVCF
jgi:hypothetical protein